MAAIVNDRDALLSAAIPRLVNVNLPTSVNATTVGGAAAIEITDWFIDPRIDELRQSKYTFPIVIGAALAVLGLGIFIGMQIY